MYHKIRENLSDAGCDEGLIGEILGFYENGDLKKMEKLIGECRKKQVEKMHQSQRCIDALDFLVYQLEK